MFDYGLHAVGVMNNIGLLGVDIGKASAFCLSHGHCDHDSSAVGIIKQHQARIPVGTPFYVGEEAFAHRYSSVLGRPNPRISDSSSGPTSSPLASRWSK